MSEAKFVQELPLNPEKGQSFWVSQGKPGFWVYMTYTGQNWIAGAGIACPYIPMIYKIRCEEPVGFNVDWFNKTNISLVPKDIK